MIIILIVCFFYQYDTFYNIENNFTDRLTTEARQTDKRIKILAIDDKSLEQLGKWPWPRSVLAEASEKLLKNGVKAVWLDVLYTEKSQNPDEDAVWDKLVKQYPNLFLSMYYNFPARQTSGQELQIANESWPVFPISREQVGHINVMEDRDRVVRKVMLGVQGKEAMIPAISVRLANVLLPNEGKINWSAQGWSQGKTALNVNNRNELFFTYATAPQSKAFETIPVADVIQGKIDPKQLKDAVILIGPYTVGMQDMYLTPMSKTLRMYGVEIHANILQALLDRQYYSPLSKILGMLLILGLAVLMYLALERFRAVKGFLIFLASMVLYTIIVITFFMSHNVLLPFFYPTLTLVMVYVTSVISQYLSERREKSRVTGIFGRFVSKAVVDEILASQEDVSVGGVRKDVTLMFIDIRGFTTLSEQMQPEQVIVILNEYLDLCTRMIFEQEGTLDKFIGDGVMAIFGAPIEQKDHAARAVRAALLIKGQAESLSQRIEKEFGRPLRFGIGINSGPAIIGNIGSSERLDYTAIGDTVNLAARLESNAKPGQILISKETYERVKDQFEIIPLGTIKVKGKEIPVDIYGVEA